MWHRARRWTNAVRKMAPVDLHETEKKERKCAQSCPTLCDPMDCSLPGSSVHGIFQAIVLEWIAISFSRGSSRPRGWTLVSHIVDRCFTAWATREVLSLVLSCVLHRIKLFSELWFWWPIIYCSVAKLCLTFCDPTDCSTPGYPVLHYLQEFAQIHIH